MSEKLTDILRVKGINCKGFGTISKLVMQDTRITIESKAIYSYFCSYAGSGDTAFPKVEKIIHDLCITRERYYDHLTFLKAYGYIRIESKKVQNEDYYRNIYEIALMPIEDLSLLKKLEEKKLKDKQKRDIKKQKKAQKTDKSRITDHSRESRLQSGNPQSGNPYNNINSIKINNNKTDRLTDISIAEIKRKINYSQNRAFNGRLVDDIVNCLYELFNEDDLVVGGKVVPLSVRREMLDSVTGEHIDKLTRRVKEYKGEISNPKAWLISVIYNALFEHELLDIAKENKGNNSKKTKSITHKKQVENYKDYPQRQYSRQDFESMYKEL